MFRPTRRVALAGAIAAVVSGMFGLSAYGADDAKAAAAATAPRVPGAPELGGADRYLTFVLTDKPVYRPGERLYVRGMVLHANSHAPLTQPPPPAVVEVTGPKGDVVASGQVAIQDSVAGFSWEIPAGTAGGEYSVKVTHPYAGHAPGARKFDVRAYRAPRLKSQIVFVRDGYGPGDTVSASVHVDRAEGGVPAGAKVTAIARVDGVEVANNATTVDERGNASARFNLPPAIARGEGSLSFVIEDGGVVETATKTIPILLQTVDLTMYPEGGDLIAGVPNRVYLEAFTPAKKPADLSGVIVNGKGVDVAAFGTAHEGRGRFSFTPEKGEAYTLRIDKPAGIRTTYPLPAAKEAGVAIEAVDDVVAPDRAVSARLYSPAGGKFKVTLASRDVLVASADVDFANQANGDRASRTAAMVDLKPERPADGVLTLTVWDEAGKTPVAERLVYRKPARQLNVDVRAEKETYVPGEAVKLTVTTTDADGRPVSAVVGLSVTDDSVLEMIERREQAPRLPVMVLLEADVRDLADAHVYLDEANPKAPLATDLLLGTQGWRRFAMVRAEEFLGKYGDAARRVLAMRVVTRQEIVELEGLGMGGGGGGGVLRGRAFGVQQNGQGERFGVVEKARREPAGAADGADRRDKPEVAAVPGVPVPVAAAPPVPAAAAAAAAAAAPQPAPDRQLAAGGIAAGGGSAASRPPVAGPAADAKLADRLEAAQERAGKDIMFAKRQAGQPAMRQDFVLVRQFAHAARAGRRPNDRVDFAETLYWNAGVRTDAKTGQASVTFTTSDAVTSFRAFADAFDNAGAVGSGAGVVTSVQPFYVEMKMPLEVTQGDEIQLPVTLVNNTADAKISTGLAVASTAGKGIRFGPIKPRAANPGTRAREVQYIGVDDVAGDFDVTIGAGSDAYTDKVTRRLRVVPKGFPVEFARGGLIGPDGGVTFDIEIPADVVAASVKSDLALYPTPLANLTQALEALIQSPSGCFEQTSSTCYPLIMAQQYFMNHQGVDPKLIERSRTLLDDGYARLTGFECKTTKGFEWFGADPGHDALSAYGLMEFTDMAIVREVDARMLRDTREFVMKSRDGQGGYKRLTHTLHTWVADPECANGYNTWALLESKADPKELATEVGWIRKNVATSANSYAVALAANVMALAGDDAAAKSFMDKLAAKQTDAGRVDGSTTSVIGSGGEALQIEATALAALAWMRDPAYTGNVEKSIKWLCEVCKGGRFGSTQSTVLSLRAIVTYDKLRAHPKAPGTIQVVVDGKNMGGVVAFDDKTQGAIKLQDVGEMLSPGRHTIALRMERGASMPFSIAVRYNTLRPLTSDACKVSVATSLRDAKLAEGAPTEAVVTVSNKAAEVVPTPIAIVGIPGGLEVRHDQLKELVKAKRIAAYEVLGREVVLYWRSLAANEKVEVPLSLTAAVPGAYAGPASRAYLYYTDEHKSWAEPMSVAIEAK
jgi:uncharacterized protein YfaS (alpha-2-macroglobulin family)